MSHAYLLSIFYINVDIVCHDLFLETRANASHQHAVVPMTAEKEVDSCFEPRLEDFFYSFQKFF